MKNLLLVAHATRTFVSANTLADPQPYSLSTSIITLLFLTLLLLSIDSVLAASAEPSGPSSAGSQNCGAIALAQLARALNADPKIEERFLNAPPPDGGFSLADLRNLAATNGIKLEAVRAPVGAELPVPSIVHWKIGHYGVIVERKGSNYRVVSQRPGKSAWVDWRSMQIYADGAFLIAQQPVPSAWQRLTETEAETLRGTIACWGFYHGGYCGGVPPDDEDPPADCCDDNDDQDADCDPPSANDGASDGGDNPPPPQCCCDMGMPRWYVSEPYINLWLVDRPLLYKTSNGKWFPLKLTYKSRGVDHGTNSFGFGPKWECNWIGMIQANATNGILKATNYHASGGLGQVNWGCDLFGSGCLHYRSSQTFITPSGGSAPMMISSRGGINQFGYAFEPMPGITNHYLDRRFDRYGRKVEYNYQVASGVAHLTTVKDTDGNISTISYNGDLISSVTDPYGHTAHFYYMNGYLTNITDAAGMSSTFYYETNNHFIISMVTPYGTTGFNHYSDTNGNRAVLVTEANGEHQLYTFVSDVPPTSYHWNRAQYNAITDDSNYLEMLSEDYDKAQMQRWLFYATNGTGSDLLLLSETVAYSAPPVDPSFGYRPGAFSFTYQGQTNSSCTGTLKRVTSITRDGFLQVGIERNGLGRPVSVTNFLSDGSVATIYRNTFGASGRYLQKQIGPLGELVRGYGYHSAITNLLISVTNAVGDVTRYTHDTNTMKVTSITFPGGLLRSNDYSSGFLIKQTDLGFRTNSFTYSSGNVASQTDELGLATTRSYDALNRLRQINFPDGTTISNFYDKLDLVGVKDRLGLWTRYTYDQIRQLRGETNANGAVTTYEYCTCGSPHTITRWKGSTPLTDTFNYDILGRLTNATYADGYQLNYIYYGQGVVGDGLLAAVSDSSGLTLAMNYVQLGEKFKIGDAYLAGLQIVANTYDGYGRLVSTLDRNGITVTNTYDLVNRLVTRVTLDQYLTPYATNTYVYNARGLTNILDALNHTNWFVRDAAGRLQYQTNANNEVLQFTYNPADELLTLTDGKNQKTRWNYDEYGRVTNKLDQGNAEILRYTYDPESRLTNRWSAAKGNTKYKYDSVGNLTNIIYPISGTIKYSYDSLNRLTNMVDAVGTTLFTYSGSGQLLTEDGPFASDTVTNAYSNRLRTLLSLAQPTGVWTNAFGYDSANRLYTVTSSEGTFTYTYAEPSTRLTYLNLPSGAYVYNQYDTMSRLTNSFLWGSGVPFDGHVYQYDRENQRTNEVRADSSTVGYKYDNIGQLVMADSSTNTEDRGYSYDSAWNLHYRTNNGSLYTFGVDYKNQLTNQPLGSCAYDANGNLVTNTWIGYTYDDENRLTVVSDDTYHSFHTTFSYDGLGRLRKRTEYTWSGSGPILAPGWRVASTVEYIYDGWRVAQERDGNNTPTVSYTRGNDLSVSLEGAGGIGGLLARSSGYSGGNWTNHADYYADAGGNVTSLIDTNQSVLASYRYDPFGNIISKSGTLADLNVYRYSSKEVHVNSGMYYYGYRFYDPNLQRWVTTDPLEEDGGINLYGFAGQHPVNAVDPDGSAVQPPGFIGPMQTGDIYFDDPGTFGGGPYIYLPWVEDFKNFWNKYIDPPLPPGFKACAAPQLFGSSRAAMRGAMREAGIPTSRSALSQIKPKPGAGATPSRRQLIMEGADGKPRVVTQHPADAEHTNPHWHAAKPKTDPRTGKIRFNDQGQAKYCGDGTVAPYEE